MLKSPLKNSQPSLTKSGSPSNAPAPDQDAQKTTHSRIDATHCIHKHVANARVHVLECYSAASRFGKDAVCDRLQQAVSMLNRFVKALALHYASDSPVSIVPYLAADAADIRRHLQAVARDYMSDDTVPLPSRIAFFDEISFAIGHLNNIEEHLVELSPSPSEHSPDEVSE